MSTLPWTEKYRPKLFDNIIMDNIIKKTLINSIKKKLCPRIYCFMVHRVQEKRRQL